MARIHVTSHLVDEFSFPSSPRQAHPDLLRNPAESLSKAEHRQLVRDCLHLLLKQGYSPLSYFAKDPQAYFNLGEYLALVDLSLTVKMGVQYSLWGGSILNLGTEKHRKQYFTAVDQFHIPGCFAMTELKHGSNVAALQTEAVLDLATDEWVIHTPDDGAIKWWIGNAAEDGRMATVFARLKIPSRVRAGALDDFGVHAFVVPLRDSNGQPLHGVEIRDCGYKVGLQGVDNGAIRFRYDFLTRHNLAGRMAALESLTRPHSYSATCVCLAITCSIGSRVLGGMVSIRVRWRRRGSGSRPHWGSSLAVGWG